VFIRVFKKDGKRLSARVNGKIWNIVLIKETIDGKKNYRISMLPQDDLR
jgi:hypothetical protein